MIRPTRAWAALVVVGAVVLAVGLGACGVGTTSQVEQITAVTSALYEEACALADVA